MALPTIWPNFKIFYDPKLSTQSDQPRSDLRVEKKPRFRLAESLLTYAWILSKFRMLASMVLELGRRMGFSDSLAATFPKHEE